MRVSSGARRRLASGYCNVADVTRREVRAEGAIKTLVTTGIPTLLQVAALVMAICAIFDKKGAGEDFAKETTYNFFQLFFQFLGSCWAGAEAYAQSGELEGEFRRIGVDSPYVQRWWNITPVFVGSASGLILSGVGIFRPNTDQNIRDVLTLLGPFVDVLASTCNITSMESEVNYARGLAPRAAGGRGAGGDEGPRGPGHVAAGGARPEGDAAAQMPLTPATTTPEAIPAAGMGGAGMWRPTGQTHPSRKGIETVPGSPVDGGAGFVTAAAAHEGASGARSPSAEEAAPHQVVTVAGAAAPAPGSGF